MTRYFWDYAEEAVIPRFNPLLSGLIFIERVRTLTLPGHQAKIELCRLQFQGVSGEVSR